MQLLEEPNIRHRGRLTLLIFIALLFLAGVWFVAGVGPVSAKSAKGLFEVKKGEGFREVADDLAAKGFVRSGLAAKAYLLFSGVAFRLQAGTYLLSGAMGTPAIADIIRNGAQEVKITIPEGYSVYDIDEALSENYILKPGELISWAKTQKTYAEGRLFPDTYNFFLNSGPADVAAKMLANFDSKAAPLLPKDAAQAKRTLILASLLEKEVPDQDDRKIVAGIILKRLKAGMPIQVDATVCYMKRIAGARDCYPLDPVDFKKDSPYNSYLYKGLPPGPIGNPGIAAIEAAMAPEPSDYLYYLSDPKTGKTIFSETLDKQAANRVQYLHR